MGPLKALLTDAMQRGLREHYEKALTWSLRGWRNRNRSLAHFYLSIACANFKAGLWMNRGAIHYTTILQRKAGRMIWAHDAISYKFTFGKRPAKVGARVSHGEDTVSATNEQNRQALIHRLGRFAVGQCRFR